MFAISSIPLALYIHIPWCVKKCPYCDFNSHQANPQHAPDYEKYVDTLLADAQSQAQWQQGRQISSIFFGGGTPSLLPVQALNRLMAGLRACLTISPQAEITLEANPATVEHAPFADYLAAGINRLSLGVQTFSAAHLAALGRIHSASDAVQAVQAAKKAGFKRINIDLMHGLPKQSVAEAKADLQTAIKLGVGHVSWYQLTIEPNTVFYRSQPVLPVEDRLADIQHCGETLLQQAGFSGYEVSAWVNTEHDKPCVHNINYWQFGDYLAIGAGAHGKVTLLEQGKQQVYRFSKTRLPKDYLANQLPKHLNFQPIPSSELPFEFMMNALRLAAGVPTLLFEQRTGLPISHISHICDELVENGLLKENWQSRLQCTDKGFAFLNQVLAYFDLE